MMCNVTEYGVSNNLKPDKTLALQLQVIMYLLQKNDIHSNRKREKLTSAVQAFLISKCSAWSANRALDQFSPLPFCVMTRYRVVFLTGPPDFQYQNEKTCSANEELFYIENFVKN